MSLLLYDFLLALYRIAIGIAALFSEKAGKWVRGRKGLLRKLERDLAAVPSGQRIWVHCASLGEFEQGRPVIEALKVRYPQCRIILTFFSPSGYEIRKGYEGADHVYYLPMDSRRHAQCFVAAVQPSLAIFVKYEFWYHYLHTLRQQKVPTILISAAFRPSQPFFQWYGGLFRKLLHNFQYILVQDNSSLNLLAGIGITDNVAIGGDTRYDRVAAIAAQARDIPEVVAFKGTSHLVIAGSTWPADEQVLHAALPGYLPDWKLVLAPHEIDTAHISQIRRLFGDEAVCFSELLARADTSAKKVLIIDNIGMLSSLYRYGAIAYVGGGFNKGGIHNILEPAVFGLPVVFGPEYRKFVEANALVAKEYAFPVVHAQAGREVLLALMRDTAKREALHIKLRQHMEEQRGATDKVLAVIQQYGWLNEPNLTG